VEGVGPQRPPSSTILVHLVMSHFCSLRYCTRPFVFSFNHFVAQDSSINAALSFLLSSEERKKHCL